MKMLKFEWEKLIRSSGFKNLCIGILVINFLLVFFADITETQPQKQQEHISNYSANISYIIRVAERNRIDYEYTSGHDSYIVKYQDDIIEIYSSLLEKGVKPEETVGWNEYFSFATDDLCLLLFAVIVGVILTMTEYDNRTDLLLKITPCGKRSTHQKIAVFGFASLGFAVITTLVTILGFAVRFGLSSPFVPLCSVIEFLYCPYDISIFEYLIVSVLIKTLNMFLLMLFSACVADFLKSYIAPLFASLCILAAGYGVSFITTNSSWIYLNCYSIGMTDNVFERYRSVNLFGESVSIIIIISLLLLIACILLCALFHLGNIQYSKSSIISLFEKSFKRYIGKIKEKLCTFYTVKPKRHSLFVSEAKKSFIKSKLIILCIIMLCFKLYYSESSVPQASEYEPYYRNICTEMAGELTEEKRMIIQNKLTESAEIISQHEQIRNDFSNGRITNKEYNTYREKFELAHADQFAYGKLYEQSQRIDNANENGVIAQLLYDTGWQYLFNAGSDIILYAFLLLFFCGIYSPEYNSGFDKIARTTQSGMEALHKAKLKLAVAVTFIAFILFFGLDIVNLTNTYPLSNAVFSSASITETSSSIPLWTSMILFAMTKFVLSLLLSFLICQLSRLLKKTYLSFSAGLLIAALFYVINSYF